MNPDHFQVDFEENIQVNTVLEISKSKGTPAKEKLSKLIVITESPNGITPLADIEFDMSSNLTENARPLRFFLNQHPENKIFKIKP